VRNSLPNGLALVSTPSVVFGSLVSSSQPSITPSTLPATGVVTIQWSFGTIIVKNSSNVADRQITISFIGQVQNIATVFSGVQLSINASTIYNGITSSIGMVASNSTTIAVTITEPSLAVSISQITMTSPINAGDVIKFSIRVDNIGAYPAFDLQLFANIDPLMYLQLSSSAIAVSNSSAVSIDDPTITGSSLTWGRGQPDYNAGTSVLAYIAPGSTIFLTFNLVASDSVNTLQVTVSFSIDSILLFH